MNGLLFKTWDRLNSSFWFVPGVMSAAAVGLAYLTVAIDESVGDATQNWGWIFGGGAEGAGSVLRTIAGSMIALAGVVFSMTLVVLSLASSQLGPRLLRNFMSDTPTQVVLGTFVATFLYCLLVLRTVRHVDGIFVPNIAVTTGVLLAVLSVGVLVFFIHHVSVSIQPNEIAARIANESIAELECLFPEHIGQAPSPSAQPDTAFLARFAQEARSVAAKRDGYVQFVDGESLVELAAKRDAVLRLEQRPGEYVVAGTPLLRIWPAQCWDDELEEGVRAAIALGHHRTAGQDFEFAIGQLVEIALRALSPSLNDPFTAMASIDRLGSVLARLAQREMPGPYRHDAQNKLRVIAAVPSFPDLLDTAFDQIRQYGATSSSVLARLLETIVMIARFAHRPEDRAALLRHAELVARTARSNLAISSRKLIAGHLRAARLACTS